jgi:hypothetical protein
VYSQAAEPGQVWYGQPQAAPATEQPFPTGRTIGGLLCALIALLFLPPLFGAAAVGFGFWARKANEGMGNTIIALGIGATVVGMVLSVLVFMSVS